MKIQSDNSDVRSNLAALCVGTPSPSGEGWSEVSLCASTPLTHTIAFPTESCEFLPVGSIISIHNQNGLCCGAIPVQNQNLVLTAFGDDPTTAQIDGLLEGEPLQFRVLNPETGKKFPLTAEFDTQMPHGGYFVNHGLSAIKDLQITGLDDNQDLGINFSIYPNPSTKLFHIRYLTGFENLSGLTTEWEVSDMHGSVVAFGNNQINDFSINLSSHPKGIYYLKITKGVLQTVKKLVVQ